ncbi:MAG: hypothetical protein KAJ30_07715, partial [Candidatus Heimdallarchaeota archaeon]|nr:hypothetical protein [Candidatus Heimdallarchaeota archaeon]
NSSIIFTNILKIIRIENENYENICIEQIGILSIVTKFFISKQQKRYVIFINDFIFRQKWQVVICLHSGKNVSSDIKSHHIKMSFLYI